MGISIPPDQKFGQTSPAVVAEWLRRLTRNQFPSGSAGSNPADCEIFWSKNLHRPGIEPGPPAWQASILPLNQRFVNFCYQVLCGAVGFVFGDMWENFKLTFQF